MCKHRTTITPKLLTTFVMAFDFSEILKVKLLKSVYQYTLSRKVHLFASKMLKPYILKRFPRFFRVVSLIANAEYDLGLGLGNHQAILASCLHQKLKHL